jgi:hypothetical protein
MDEGPGGGACDPGGCLPDPCGDFDCPVWGVPTNVPPSVQSPTPNHVGFGLAQPIFPTGPGVDYSWLGLLQWAGLANSLPGTFNAVPGGVNCADAAGNAVACSAPSAVYSDNATCTTEGGCTNTAIVMVDGSCDLGDPCAITQLSQRITVETDAANKYILGPVAVAEGAGLGTVGGAAAATAVSKYGPGVVGWVLTHPGEVSQCVAGVLGVYGGPGLSSVSQACLLDC